jgi:hypothetical protein
MDLGVEHVHRAALALDDAAGSAQQLGHHRRRIGAAGQDMTVVAVARQHVVLGLGRVVHADRHRLLAVAQVAEAADLLQAVELARLFLETADEQHRIVHRMQGIRTIEPALMRQAFALLFLFGGHDLPRKPSVETANHAPGTPRQQPDCLRGNCRYGPPSATRITDLGLQ